MPDFLTQPCVSKRACFCSQR